MANVAKALLLAWAAGACGCSWIFMTSAPEQIATPNAPVECTTNAAPPIIDTVCAGYFLLAAVEIAALPVCPPGSTDRCIPAGTSRGPAVAITGGLAALCGVAAWSGYSSRANCQQVKKLNDKCIAGDRAACDTLRPGWEPSWSPQPPPQGELGPVVPLPPRPPPPEQPEPQAPPPDAAQPQER